jgi:hypothetical protein
MDENAIGIMMSNADTKHQISFESGIAGMKLGTHLHTENRQKN